MSYAAARFVEKRIVRRIIRDALAAGYLVAVHDGHEFALERSLDRKAILDAAFNLDIADLIFYAADAKPDDWHDGWVRCVYGNDGYDVISDYADNEATNAVLKGSLTLSRAIETC